MDELEETVTVDEKAECFHSKPSLFKHCNKLMYCSLHSDGCFFSEHLMSSMNSKKHGGLLPFMIA